MSFGRRVLSALRKIGIVAAVVVLFLFGMVGTVYLSLRTREVKVPDITGKDRYAAEQMLENAGLKMRVRGTRPSASKPDVVLNQVPEAGLTVKEGIPVTVQVSRLPKEGESVPTAEEEAQQENANNTAENANANQASTANQNQNQSQNQNKPKNKNKNSNNSNNKNSNNSNNANKANQNRNANSSNMNTNRNANTHNANTLPNVNRTITNPNANRRPVITTPPFNPGANRRTP
ncbi:MAG TPA: PASTA domain-containing protein [Pyrinomonadaceae bacterium]|nr:PASTA domain-containing protein [Pyrinomonadaceae bacterium]